MRDAVSSNFPNVQAGDCGDGEIQVGAVRWQWWTNAMRHTAFVSTSFTFGLRFDALIFRRTTNKMDGGCYFFLCSFQFIDGIFKCRVIALCECDQMGSVQIEILMEKSEKSDARLRNWICCLLHPSRRPLSSTWCGCACMANRIAWLHAYAVCTQGGHRSMNASACDEPIGGLRKHHFLASLLVLRARWGWESYGDTWQLQWASGLLHTGLTLANFTIAFSSTLQLE